MTVKECNGWVIGVNEMTLWLGYKTSPKKEVIFDTQADALKAQDLIKLAVLIEGL